MNKKLLQFLFIAFLLMNFSVTAQEKYELKCKMSLEEILHSQPFDIDHPKVENTKQILVVFNEEFAIVYERLNNGDTEGLEENITAIESAILKAKEIGMNYSMYSEDIEFLEELK